MYNWLGYLAATMTTLAFVPQVIKIHKERSAKSISIKTFYIFSLGILCWLLYGFTLKSLPIIIANSATLILCIVIIVLIHTYKERD